MIFESKIVFRRRRGGRVRKGEEKDCIFFYCRFFVWGSLELEEERKFLSDESLEF